MRGRLLLGAFMRRFYPAEWVSRERGQKLREARHVIAAPRASLRPLRGGQDQVHLSFFRPRYEEIQPAGHGTELVDAVRPGDRGIRRLDLGCAVLASGPK